MASARWQFILNELNGTQIGEITNAQEREVSLPLLRMPTAGFKVKIDHPLASHLVTRNQAKLLKIYRTGTTGVKKLVFNGPIVSAEESGEAGSQSIAVNAAGAFFRLNKRIIGRTKGGAAFYTTAGDPPVPVPKNVGLVVQDILTLANTGGGSNFTGITMGSNSSVTNVVYGPVWLKNAGEAIAELASVADFEFYVEPVEPTTFPMGGAIPKIGELNVVALVGTAKPNAIFEYGSTGRGNVSSYTRSLSRDTIVNRGIISVQGWPEGAGDRDIIIRDNSSSITGNGVYEDIIPDSSVVDDDLRTLIADAHVAVRGDAREIVTFKPGRNVKPEPFVDYELGDQVRGRAVVTRVVRFDAMFRIWGMTFGIDEAGNEDVTLEMVQP